MSLLPMVADFHDSIRKTEEGNAYRVQTVTGIEHLGEMSTLTVMKLLFYGHLLLSTPKADFNCNSVILFSQRSAGQKP